MGDDRETGHLMGDVPALVLVAGVLWLLSPKNEAGAPEGSVQGSRKSMLNWDGQYTPLHAIRTARKNSTAISSSSY